MSPLLRYWILISMLAHCALAAEPSRAPWTTSKVVGSPDPPPPYKVVRVHPNLKFNRPLLLVR